MPDVSISDDSSTIQMAGLISDMDISSITEKLLTLEAAQKENYEEKVDELSLEKEIWTDVKEQLETFLDAVEYLNKYESWDEKSVTSTDTSVIGAAAESSASQGTYDFVVYQLATANAVASDHIDTIIGTSGNDSSTDLGDAGIISSDSTFYINGTAINVYLTGSEENDSLESIRNTINNTTFDEGQGVTASIIDDTLVLTSDDSGLSNTICLQDDDTTHILEEIGLMGQVYTDSYTAGLYQFDTGSGTTATDSSSGGNNGTINASWTSTSKYGSWALDFDRASSNEVTISSATENEITSNDLTLEAWVNADAGMLADGMGIISKGDMDSAEKAYSLEANADGTVTFRLSSDGSNWTSITSTGTITEGQYDHVAGVVENGVMKIYINGEEDSATGTFTGNIYNASSEDVHIGRSSTEYFDGKIDEVRISSEARTDFNAKNELSLGQDSIFTVNNIIVTRSENTNLTDVVSHLTIDIGTTGSSTVTVDNDSSSIEDGIIDFVSAYNTIQEYIRGLIYVEATGEYEEDVVTGELQGNQLLTNLSIQLRNYMGMLVDRDAGEEDNEINYLGRLGIETEGEEYNLTISDATKLTNALANNFEDVEYLFRGKDSAIATKIYTVIEALTQDGDGIIEQKKEIINDKITDLENRIIYEEGRLDRLQDQLALKFANMESSIIDMDSQLTQFMSEMFGS